MVSFADGGPEPGVLEHLVHLAVETLQLHPRGVVVILFFLLLAKVVDVVCVSVCVSVWADAGVSDRGGGLLLSCRLCDCGSGCRRGEIEGMSSLVVVAESAGEPPLVGLGE